MKCDEAVQTLFYLDALDAIDCDKLADWVMGLQREDGGFNEDVHHDDYDISNIMRAVRTLVTLDVPFDHTKVAEHTMTYYSPETGGFGSMPGGTPGFVDTFLGVYTLAMLGQHFRLNREKTINFILQSYDPKSCSFGGPSGPDFRGYLHMTYQGLMALEMLGAIDRVNASGVAAFILSCQDSRHGGFLSFPQAPEAGVQACRAAHHCLCFCA